MEKFHNCFISIVFSNKYCYLYWVILEILLKERLLSKVMKVVKLLEIINCNNSPFFLPSQFISRSEYVSSLFSLKRCLSLIGKFSTNKSFIVDDFRHFKMFCSPFYYSFCLVPTYARKVVGKFA